MPVSISFNVNIPLKKRPFQMSETDNVTENEDVNIAVREEDIINHDLQMTSSPAMETVPSGINVEPNTSTIIAHPSDEIHPDTEMEQSTSDIRAEVEQPTAEREPEAEQPGSEEKEVIIDQPISDKNAESEQSTSSKEIEMKIDKSDTKSVTVTAGETEATLDAE